MKELILFDHFYLYIRYWWFIVIATLIGGVVGFIFSRMNPPQYEATTIFYLNIDLTKVKEPPLPLHDEDLALAMIQGALLHPQVIENLVQELKKSDPQLDSVQLLANHILERKNEIWELRYRHPDPLVAQKTVNLWATKGYEEYLAQKNEGKIPPYVISNEPLLSGTPTKPVVYPPTQLILAGSVLGFALGLLIIEWRGQSGGRPA